MASNEVESAQTRCLKVQIKLLVSVNVTQVATLAFVGKFDVVLYSNCTSRNSQCCVYIATVGYN